jgi:gliding motility-associated-like protein
VTGTPNWTVSYTLNGTPQTQTGSSSPISLGNAPATYVLTNIADASCTNLASGTETIVIITLNSVTPASSNPTLCINTAISSNITFTTTGATGIGAPVGLPAGVTANFAGNTITVSGTPTATGTFNYTIPLTGGCGSVNATGTITVTPNNTVTTASSNPSLCVNTAISPSITFTTTGATGIGAATGLPAGVTASFAGNTITVSGTPTATGTFNYTIPLTGGCGSVNATGTITINALPVITLSQAGPFSCNATDGEITVNGTGTGNVVWNGPTSSSSNGVPLNYTITGLGAGTYGVYFVDGNGCQSATVSTSLANPGAPVLNNPGPQTQCDSYTLPAIGGSNLSGSQAYYNDSQVNGGAVITGPITTSQIVWIYDTQGSCPDEESFVVTINNTPSITNPGAQTACATYTLPVITGSNLSAGVAYYDDSQANGGSVITGPITTSQTIWIYDANGTCTDESSFVVTVNELPDAYIGGGGVFCNPPPNFNPVIIGVSNFGTPDFTLTYSVNGVPNTLNVTNPQNIYLGSSSGINTYQLISISDQYCTNVLSGSVIVEITYNYTIPVVVEGDSTYCVGNNSALLSVVPNGTTVWYNLAGDTLSIGSSFVPPSIEGATTYLVQQSVNDCQGPPASVSVTMIPCDYTIPTAFTPNADGLHDDWEIYGLDVAHPNNVVRIYNRWGGLLFEHDSSVDGPYDSNRWKGDYNGEALPVASYYYIIDLNDEEKTVRSGAVSILLEK